MSAKVLLLDIETSPMVTLTWGIHEQNIGLNQVVEPSYIIAWSAKWLDKKEIFYSDQRKSDSLKGGESDLLEPLVKLVDEADIVIGHNVKKFDLRKINSGVIKNELKKPSSYKIIDTLTISRKHFNLPSYKLEYLAEFLGCKHKKLTKRKYHGMTLWTECCLNDNQDAWKEMEKYNKQDVIVLEEVYNKLIPWDDTINFGVYENTKELVCSCGSKDFSKNGFAYTKTCKYQRYECVKCGKEKRGHTNLLGKDEDASQD